MLAFDNLEELTKIKSVHPRATLVLRLSVDDSSSVFELGSKFGANIEDLPRIFKKVIDLDLNLIGVSFHVGSQCLDGRAYYEAVRLCSQVFSKAKSNGIHLTLLDIGGGFPDDQCVEVFKEIAHQLNRAFDEFFDFPVKIIGEPGRFFTASAFTLAAMITSKRVQLINPTMQPDTSTNSSKKIMYYINDGLYGTLNNVLLDHFVATPKILTCKSSGFREDDNDEVFPSTLWGPTCDSLDMIIEEFVMPELEIGDWIYFENMGAYTISVTSEFNGFPRAQVLHINNLE